ARALMEKNKLAAIMITGGTSLVYFTNIQRWLSERLFELILPAKDEPFFVSPAFEEDRAREQISGEFSPFGGSSNLDVRTWQEEESPYLRIVQGLKDRGIATATLAIEETTRFVYSDTLAQNAPTLKIASATPVTAGCRMIK